MQSSSLISTNHQQINIQFLQARCPSCCPTNSVKALKGKMLHSMDLLTPSSPGGLPTLSLNTNSSWLPWGRDAMPLISPLMPVPQGMETTVRILMVNSCNSVVTGSSGHGSMILVGLGQVTGQGDRPSVWPGFVAFAHVSLLLLGRAYATFESVGFCVLYVVYFFYSELVNNVVLFTRRDSSNQVVSGC